jgi:hypothetical protein
LIEIGLREMGFPAAIFFPHASRKVNATWKGPLDFVPVFQMWSFDFGLLPPGGIASTHKSASSGAEEGGMPAFSWESPRSPAAARQARKATCQNRKVRIAFIVKASSCRGGGYLIPGRNEL